MSTNHELSAYAAIRCMRSTDDDVVKQCLTDIIADTYAEPMAELEKLRRQVALARKRMGIQKRSILNNFYCEFCGASHKNDRSIKHSDDCPHNEVAT